jgi:hypothetical protein
VKCFPPQYYLGKKRDQFWNALEHFHSVYKYSQQIFANEIHRFFVSYFKLKKNPLAKEGSSRI